MDKPLDRNLFLSGGVDSYNIEDLSRKIIEIGDDDANLKNQFKTYSIFYYPKPIKLYIQNYGGSVYDALSLCNIIKGSKTPVYTYTTGLSASAAFIISIVGVKRFAYKNTFFMNHELSYDSYGELENHRIKLKSMNNLENCFTQIILENTKITKKQLKKYTKRKRDWVMDSSEALKLGVIDEII